MEKRAFKAELRAEPGSPSKIVGYAAVFNSPSVDLGGFREIIRPGAFSAALAAEGLNCICNVDHCDQNILGRSKSGTLRLSEDDHGLLIECDLPDTGLGHDIAALMTRGDYSSMSFAFVPTQEKWGEQDGEAVREIIECELFDVSVVLDPCYEATEVALRSLEAYRASQTKPDKPKLRRAKRFLEICRRHPR